MKISFAILTIGVLSSGFFVQGNKLQYTEEALRLASFESFSVNRDGNGRMLVIPGNGMILEAPHWLPRRLEELGPVRPADHLRAKLVARSDGIVGLSLERAQ